MGSRGVRKRRLMPVVVAGVLLSITSCGGGDGASRRTLNSVACFETAEDKEAARTAAAEALNPPASPTPPLVGESEQTSLFEASGSGYRVPAYRRPADDVSTTSSSVVTSSTNPPSSSSTTTVASESSTTVVDEESESEGDTSTTIAPDEETSTTVVSNPQAPASSEPTQEDLASALQAIIDTPLCSELDTSVDDQGEEAEYVDVPCTVIADFLEEYLTITSCEEVTQITYSYTNEGFESFGASLTNDITINTFGSTATFAVYVNSTVVASGSIEAGTKIEIAGSYLALASDVDNGDAEPVVFDGDDEGDEENLTTCGITVENDLSMTTTCEVPLVILYSYYTADNGDDPVRLYGTESSTFGPIEGIRDVYVTAHAWNTQVFGQTVEAGVYEFPVSLLGPDEPDDTENDIDDDDPQLFSGEFTPVGQTVLRYPIREGESFFAEFYTDCDEQSISAVAEGEFAPVQFEVMPSYVLNEGLCGVWLWSPMPFDFNTEVTIVVTTRTSYPVEWSSYVDFDTVDRPDGIEYDELKAEVTAPQTYLLNIPDGGRWFFAKGNSNAQCSDDVVDPYLLLLDESDNPINYDDDTASTPENCYGSLLEIFLDAGYYSLVATTWDLVHEGDVDAREDAPTQYELIFGIEIRPGDSLGSPEPVPVASPEPEAIAAAVGPAEKAPSVVVPVDLLTSDSDGPSLAVTLDVTNMMCDESCVDDLFQRLGPDAESITIRIGQQSVNVGRDATLVKIPINSSSDVVELSAADSSGTVIFESSTPLVVMTPDVVPSRKATYVPYVNPSGGGSSGLPWPWISGVLVALVAVGALMRRRQQIG